MNNLLNFNDYKNRDLEKIVYTNAVNEGTGIRGFFNKVAIRKIRTELSDEIEMSKTIMDGITEGLESLNDNFDEIKKGIDGDDNKSSKGEKQKILDNITKLLEDSRKSTWDINELIDEGEIDYAGFTANVGAFTVGLFGVLISPIRARMIVHKGYNYFFSIVKNTIRKSLVMLQLNFDQFENLIITKSFQSLGYMQEVNDAEKVSEIYGKLQTALFDKDKGSMKNKRGHQEMEAQLRLVINKLKDESRMKKNIQSSENAYNCLDMYQNTYTKSLETLRSYTQDDVQKQQDGIKNTITKMAAGDVDLQAYGEMIIATAEEHAYKVSASIYNKFAKMTEVFSLPNQKKMIDLIQAATKEQLDAAEKERQKKLENDRLKELEEEADRVNKSGEDIFNKVDGSSLGDLDKKTGKYSDVDASKWTYDELKNLNDEDRENFEKWLMIHPEVWDKCDETLKIAVPMDLNDGYFKYIDPLIKYIRPCLVEENDNSSVLNFDDFCINEAVTKKEYKFDSNEVIDNVDNIKKIFTKHKKKATIALEVIGYKILNDKSFTENAKKIVGYIDDMIKNNTKKISKSLYKIIVDGIDKLKDERSHDFPSLQGNTNNKEEEKKSGE